MCVKVAVMARLLVRMESLRRCQLKGDVEE